MDEPLTREAAVAAYIAGEGTYREIGERAGVSHVSIRNWVQAFQRGEGTTPRRKRPPSLKVLPGGKAGQEATVTGNGRVSLKAEGLDTKARRLLRASAERFLGCMAGNVDELGRLLPDEGWNPKTAKDAALGLAVVVDKCPGILGLHDATEAPADMVTDLKPGDPGFDEAVVEWMARYPSLAARALKRSG